ncbi:MAG TPA: peptidylprolyl isomerase, partial [Thermomicrobiales bacterium]|nr:peptidylprolyl isomerase [Thermomicrobiales bacterium]
MANRRKDTLPKNRHSPTAGPASQRRISRREREAKQRKQLYGGLIIAAVLSVIIVGGFALNEYWFKPRAVLASVNGVEIRRRDYWKVRSLDLVNQANQYQQFAQLVDASQQQQYLTLAQQAVSELQNVWGSTDIDDATLTKMVEDQVYLQGMDSLGLSITDADVQTYIQTQFQPSDAPIVTATPSPTLIPQRAEWATQTEVALEADQESPTAVPTEIAGSPVGSPESAIASPIGSPVVDGTPAASPVANGSPSAVASPVTETSPSVVASPITDASPTVIAPEASPTEIASPVAGSPEASPSAIASPIGSPVQLPTETVASTPNPTQAVETAEAGYDLYRKNIFGTVHMSKSDYVRLVVRPALARQMVTDNLLKDVGQSAPQVHAEHILVDTKDLADAIYGELQAGANFEDTAREQSNDTSTAANGGDLGWFTKGQMVQQFEDVAFSLQPGQISQPFQSQYGWHIVKVLEVDPNRAMTDSQLTQYKDAITTRWVDAQRATMSISSKVEPTPTPAISSFVPPADAPALPTETVVEASPVVAGSPEAVASPIAEASPVASPVNG